MWEKLKQLARRYDEIGELLEVPEIYADPKKLRALTREQKELSAVYELPEKVDAPVAAGQLLGTLRYVAGNETIASVPISAAESVERVGVGELWVRLAAALCGRTNTQ